MATAAGEGAAAPEDYGSAPAARQRRFRVYTRTGDKGNSSLYNGERRGKDDDLFSALGDVDELNAVIGLAAEFCQQGSVHVGGSGAASAGGGVPVGSAARVDYGALPEQLQEIQSRLLDVGSAIATPIKSSRPEQLARAAFAPGHAEQLERWIDAMDDELPPLQNFILPSGGLASCQLHVARTVCRRAERQAVILVKDGQLSADVGIFLNRLSDFLFVAARFAAMRAGQSELVYKKSKGLLERDLSAAAAAGGGAPAAAAAAAVDSAADAKPR